MTDIAGKEPVPTSQIRIAAHGPYLVSEIAKLGTRAPVRNPAGEAVEWASGADFALEGTTALCRCGHSASKPFCDNTHRTIGFDGTCTASRSPGAARRKVLEGAGVTMTDDESLCAGYEYCDRHGGVWRTITRTADPQVREELMRQVALCPSGRLQYVRQGAREPEEVAYPPTLATIANGPLWALGAIDVVMPDGYRYESRNRQLLCRCGASGNKPFCDGSHHKLGFKAP